MDFIYLIVGGSLGTIARHFVTQNIQVVTLKNFPWGTFTVNLLGCLLIGFFSIIIEKKFMMSAAWRLILISGFCGAFTTFSTFMFEIHQLIQTGTIGRAFLYLVSSVVLGFCCFLVGMWAAGQV